MLMCVGLPIMVFTHTHARIDAHKQGYALMQDNTTTPQDTMNDETNYDWHLMSALLLAAHRTVVRAPVDLLPSAVDSNVSNAYVDTHVETNTLSSQQACIDLLTAKDFLETTPDNTYRLTKHGADYVADYHKYIHLAQQTPQTVGYGIELMQAHFYALELIRAKNLQPFEPVTPMCLSELQGLQHIAKKDVVDDADIWQHTGQNKTTEK